jgi:multiple sugar transport system substrate-binding protein
MIKRWAAMLIFLGIGAYVFAGGTKEVTPQNAMQASSNVATSMQALEKSTADAAFAASPKGTVNAAWKGKTFTIATLASGPNGAISGPLYFWRPYFQQLTGATYNIVEIPFGDLQAKIETDFSSGAGQYDAVVGPQFMMGDYVAHDWIIPIDKYLTDPAYPKQDLTAIAPSYQALDKYGSHWYAFNNDHDGMILYYRRDLFDNPKWQAEFKAKYNYAFPNPPQTWKQLVDVADFFNSVEWNGPGKPHQGIALHLKVGEQGFFDFLSIAAPYVVSPAPGSDPRMVTRYNNVFWFDPQTMKPLINTTPFVRALETEIALYKAGSPAQISWALGEAWNAFLTGQAAMCYSFGDVTPLAESAANSLIKGEVGAAPTPGSTDVYDFQTDKWIASTKINFVGNEDGASWSGVISRKASDPDLVAYFLAWQATMPINHWNTTWGFTGINPGTKFDFFPPFGYANVEDYVKAGYNKQDAIDYVDAWQKQDFEYPLSLPYLRIPGTPDYLESLDIHLSEALSGQVSAQVALDRIAADWNRITDRLGHDQQLKYYQEAIGYHS